MKASVHIWRFALVAGSLLTVGCSASFINGPRFTGIHVRLGVDTRLGNLRISHEGEQRTIELQDLQSIPREDIAKAIAEGVAAGVARAITHP